MRRPFGPADGGLVQPADSIPFLEISESTLREMVMNDPSELVRFAQKLGLDIGTAKDLPMLLLSRLLALADGFREG